MIKPPKTNVTWQEAWCALVDPDVEYVQSGAIKWYLSLGGLIFAPQPKDLASFPWAETCSIHSIHYKQPEYKQPTFDELEQVEGAWFTDSDSNKITYFKRTNYAPIGWRGMTLAYTNPEAPKYGFYVWLQNPEGDE